MTSRTETTAVDVSGRRRKVVAPLVISGLVLLVLLAFVIVTGQSTAGRLDPQAIDPQGSRAAANVLRSRGVEVQRVTTAQQAGELVAAVGEGSTVVIVGGGAITPAMGARLTVAPAHYVFIEEIPIAPGPWDDLVPGDGQPTRTREPGCDLAAASRAGSARAGGTSFRGGVVSCYDGTVVESGPVTVLGSGDLFTNDYLADDGNASLALSLLGRDRHLIWWLTSPTDPDLIGSEQKSLTDFVPPWVVWVVLQLFVAIVVFAFTRRRMGRLILEPLPVTVRAAETIEGLARLFRRAGTREHVATRLGTTRAIRLRQQLHLPANASIGDIATATAVRTGRDPVEVRALLEPAAPMNDQALITYLDQLDQLERQALRQ